MDAPLSSTSSVELDTPPATESEYGSGATATEERRKKSKSSKSKKKKKVKEKEKEKKKKKGKDKESSDPSSSSSSSSITTTKKKTRLQKNKKERRTSDADSKVSQGGGGPSLSATSLTVVASRAGGVGGTLKKDPHPHHLGGLHPVAPAAEDQDYMDNHHEIGIKEILVVEMLGEGSFCNVWKGKCRGKEVLIRILKLQSNSLSHKDISELREEVKRLSKIRNPHIVLFMGACLEPGYLTLVTEYMPSNLEIKLLRDRDRKDITPYQRLKMAKDAALGIQWLHKMNTPMVHMNLHLSNLLVGNDGMVKIADFGFLNMRRKCAGRRDLASFVYMAPEFLRDGTKSEKCDVYSFACCLAEILTGAFDTTTTARAIFGLLRERAPRVEVFKSLKREILLSNQPEVVLYDKIVIRGTRPKLSADHVPPPLAALIRRSWSPKPEERPNFDEIINVLDTAIIDAVINDNAGRALWRDNFTGRTRVTWEDFVAALCGMFMIPLPVLNDDKKLDVHWRCLKALLVKGGIDDPDGRLMQGSGMVTLESFGGNLACFGPLMNLMGVAFLTRIRSVVELECFHGYITPEMAEERLADQQPGTFLLRLSSHAGIFTVSVVTRKGVEHKRILYKATSDFGPVYLYNSCPHRSLNDLLRAERASFQHPFSSSRYKKLLALDVEVGSSSGVPSQRLKADYLIPNGWDDDRS
ncbi:protein kinase domain containing protein [Acanthamoeba castellanii str. Neff]|uniref:Protein kinase domain containing protein n=1 Tax=Acanthamoeba castellanii (strain ATCC 30010 / Neff) TaxID=1257118 RepID=L8GQ12_ACACF|nr:protein kinase domain containing protein [Acanthamoeba castellanii str. Neff]ELR14206.1 protein kinase domain containing protein [Acanthamoeba castellanii str. Neff]